MLRAGIAGAGQPQEAGGSVVSATERMRMGREYGQRDSKSRVGLAGAGMESGRFAHGQRGSKERVSLAGAGLGRVWGITRRLSGRMRMDRG